MAQKADINSPTIDNATLTGVPTAPSTAPVSTNTNQIATTAWVRALLVSEGLI